MSGNNKKQTLINIKADLEKIFKTLGPENQTSCTTIINIISELQANKITNADAVTRLTEHKEFIDSRIQKSLFNKNAPFSREVETIIKQLGALEPQQMPTAGATGAISTRGDTPRTDKTLQSNSAKDISDELTKLSEKLTMISQAENRAYNRFKSTNDSEGYFKAIAQMTSQSTIACAKCNSLIFNTSEALKMNKNMYEKSKLCAQAKGNNDMDTVHKTLNSFIEEHLKRLGDYFKNENHDQRKSISP